MTDPITPREARELIKQYLNKRAGPRLGLILEPPNPFQPEVRRKLRKGFVLFTLLFLAAAGAFVYFNLVS